MALFCESLTTVQDAIKKYSLSTRIDTSLINILYYLIKRSGAKTLIRETEYIDKDFGNELSNLYSKTFKYRHGFCERWHFFADDFQTIEVFYNQFNKGEFRYFGFIVKRPLPVGKVGRTLIEPKKIDNFFYLCNIKREVHLLGKTIQACGVPFIEQDSMVITCAQAGIWVVAKFMHYTYSHGRFYPYEITEKANQSLNYAGRALPSSGLTSEQIIVALNNMGCFPVLYQHPNKLGGDIIVTPQDKWIDWDPMGRIYSYIESEIPILLLFDSHLCTAIGHKVYDDISKIDLKPHIDQLFKREERKNKEIKRLNPKRDYSQPHILSSCIFVDALIVHDDTEGIYRLLPLDEKNKENLSQYYEDLLSRRANNIRQDIETVIIALPDKVYLLAEDVFEICMSLFDLGDSKNNIAMAPTVLQLIKRSKTNKYACALSESLFNPEDPVILRIYFIKSIEFKKRILNNKIIDIEVKSKYLEMNMPRFIWVAEVSFYSLYSETKHIIGELLFDSTANKFDFSGSCLSAHLPGLFFIWEKGGKEPDNLEMEDPYTIRTREKTEQCSLIN